MSAAILPFAIHLWESLTARLRGAGEVIPRLVMRLIMGWEFWEAGIEKYRGSNWFSSVQDSFPFPFNLVPPDLSWAMATWTELVCAVLLWLGLFTRFAAFSLLVLTFVATAAVHWPDMWTMWTDLLKGYSISDNGHGNFKLPLLFVVMLLPLIFNGAGRLSLDYLLARTVRIEADPAPLADLYAWAIAALVLGIPFLMLIPTVGVILLGIALVLGLAGRFLRA